MRWLLLLFVLNVLVGFWHWSESRAVKPVKSYEVDEQAIELAISPLGKGCLLMGPLESEELASSFVYLLQQEGLKAELMKRDQEKAPRYWVYYGPMASYEASLEQRRSFKSEGIDNFIITQEELYGALSIGVFENIDSARRMQAQMKRKGYQTSVRNIYQFESLWWVQIELVGNRDKINKIKALQSGLGVHLEMREFFCKTVASVKPFP